MIKISLRTVKSRERRRRVPVRSVLRSSPPVQTRNKRRTASLISLTSLSKRMGRRTKKMKMQVTIKRRLRTRSTLKTKATMMKMLLKRKKNSTELLYLNHVYKCTTANGRLIILTVCLSSFDCTREFSTDKLYTWHAAHRHPS